MTGVRAKTPVAHPRHAGGPFATRILAAMVLVVIAAAQARACPPGTRFSGYNGSGICVIPGQGARVTVRCQIASGACPSGTTRQHSNSDPTRDYCCPRQAAGMNPPRPNQFEACTWVGTAPFCKGSCPAGFKARLSDVRGDGAKCVTGLKFYCCRSALPDPNRR